VWMYFDTASSRVISHTSLLLLFRGINRRTRIVPPGLAAFQIAPPSHCILDAGRQLRNSIGLRLLAFLFVRFTYAIPTRPKARLRLLQRRHAAVCSYPETLINVERCN
jgi:cytochrome b